MRTSFSSFPRRSTGFSLIEMLLALGIVITISGLILTGIRRDNEGAQAKAVGEQLKLVGTALNTYVALRYDTIVAHVPGTGDIGEPGTAADPGPRTCTNAGGGVVLCTITSETLRRNGLLPNSFSGRNAYGAQYLYQLRVEGVAPNRTVNGIVVTDTPYLTGSTTRFDLLGQAMLSAGVDSGMTRSVADRVEGYNGSWAEQGFPVVDSVGLLAYRVGYGTSGYAAYLRRDGAASMTGNLDMDGNNIDDVNRLTARRTLLTDNDPNALTFGSAVGSETAAVGTFGAGATAQLSLRHSNKVRVETMAGAAGTLEAGAVNATTVNAVTSIQSQGTLASTGNLTVGGNGTVAGGLGVGTTAPNTGEITANGIIRSNNQIQAVQLSVGSNPSGVPDAANTLIAAGAVFFNNPSNTTLRKGFQLDAGGTTIQMVNNTNLLTGGNIRSGTSSVDTKLTVGSGITVDASTLPVAGASCTGTFGEIRRATTGELVQCLADGGAGRYWKAMGLSGDSTIDATAGASQCTGAGAAINPTASTSTCPAGSVLLGGGYEASGAPRAAPIRSFRSGNSWVVYAGATDPYGTGATATSCFQAKAVCSR